MDGAGGWGSEMETVGIERAGCFVFGAAASSIGRAGRTVANPDS